MPDRKACQSYRAKKGPSSSIKKAGKKNYSISAVNDPVWVKPLNLKVKITRYTEQARVKLMFGVKFEPTARLNLCSLLTCQIKITEGRKMESKGTKRAMR